MKRGPLFEKDVVLYLKEHGFPDAERRVQGGRNDKGDVAGVPGWVLELKNCKGITLGPWLKEAAKEADNAATTRYAVVHKQKQKGVAEAFVTLPLFLFAELIGDPPC